MKTKIQSFIMLVSTALLLARFDALATNRFLNYDNLPIYFEANSWQTDSTVQFVAHGRSGTLLLARDEVWLALPSSEKENAQCALQLKFSGANPNPKIEGLNELRGSANYFTGNNPAGWRTGVPLFARVKYHEVYPGVDLIFYGNQKNLEYDFVVQPYSDPNKILLQFSGADRITLAENGDLLIKVSGNSLLEHKPIVYQESDGVRKIISGNYVIHSGMQIGFQIADYDKGKPIIIDPVLSYSITFGGTGINQALAVAVDANSNTYIAGNTTAKDFTLANPYQATFLGNQDAFVTKFDANNNLVYSTYLGGGPSNVINQTSSAQGIVVDTNGHAFLAGYTQVTNFPVMNALQVTNGGNYDAFVTELSSNGNALIYSTYLGGKGIDVANAIALDANGHAIITGYTASTNFPTANAAQPVYGGNGDAFVAKLSSGGGSLIYSTYLGAPIMKTPTLHSLMAMAVGSRLT